MNKHDIHIYKFIYIYMIYIYIHASRIPPNTSMIPIPFIRSPCHVLLWLPDIRCSAVHLIEDKVVSLEALPPRKVWKRSFLFNGLIFRFQLFIFSFLTFSTCFVELNRKLGGGGRIISCELNAASRLKLGSAELLEFFSLRFLGRL